MQTVRTVGLVLFALAVVFGLIAMFTPTGEAAATESDGTTVTVLRQTYELWGMNDARGAQDAPSSWHDASEDGTAGISYLRAAPVLLGLALITAVVALILTVAPATTQGVSGGIVGAVSFVTGILGLVLHFAGLVLRVEGFLGSPQYLAFRYASFLLAFFLLAVFVATLLGLRGTQVARVQVTSTKRPASIPATGTRRLMCPKCNTINEARVGVLPTCHSCGYST